jgi:hypothetical protein
LRALTHFSSLQDKAGSVKAGCASSVKVMTFACAEGPENASLLAKKNVFRRLAKLFEVFPKPEPGDDAQDGAMFDLRADILCLVATMLRSSEGTSMKLTAAKHGFVGLAMACIRNPLEERGLRGDAVELLNSLIDHCKPNVIALNKMTTATELLDCVATAADWCLQSVAFEVFYRSQLEAPIATLRTIFEPFKNHCDRLIRLMRPKDVSRFDECTRAFLMCFNDALGEHQRIYSLFAQGVGFADFGLVELSIWVDAENVNAANSHIDDIPLLYSKMHNVELNGALLGFAINDEPSQLFRLQFRDCDAIVLRDVLLPRIMSCIANAAAGAKMSMAVIDVAKTASHQLTTPQVQSTQIASPIRINNNVGAAKDDDHVVVAQQAVRPVEDVPPLFATPSNRPNNSTPARPTKVQHRREGSVGQSASRFTVPARLVNVCVCVFDLMSRIVVHFLLY